MRVSFDLSGGVAGFRQDFGGLLAEERWGLPGADRLAIEVIGGAGNLQTSQGRVLDVEDEVLGARLAVVHRLRHVADGSGTPAASRRQTTSSVVSSVRRGSMTA
jgi:hypothetical protein